MLKVCDVPVISLDLETGGLVPGKHTPLAIGAVVIPSIDHLLHTDTHKVTDANSFYVQLEWDTIVVDPMALRINSLNIANPPGPNGTIENRSFPATTGLGMFSDWLAQHGSSLHALGMNVGSFDIPMLKSIWKNSRWPFHYRSFDLNTLFFALSHVQTKPFKAIKEEITKIAWEKSPFPKKLEHNALADAWSNLYVWEECLRRFLG